MNNTQPAEKLDRQFDDMLDIQEIFWTLQGEGPFVGVPAVFIRTAGCNFLCRACDSDYTSRRKRMLIGEIVSKVQFAFDHEAVDHVPAGGCHTRS